MKALLIIAAVIFCLLMLKPWVRIIYDDGEFYLKAGLLCFQKQIIPKKRKKVNPKDYTPKAIRRRREKVLKKAEKEKRRAEKESAKKAKVEEKPEEGKKKKSLDDIMPLIRLILRVLKIIVRKLNAYLDFRIYRLWLSVASKDPDKTAVMYGAVSGAVSGLLAFMSEHGRVRYKAPKGYDAVYVEADFLAQKPRAKVEIQISIRVWQVFALVNSAAFTFISGWLKNKKTAAERN
ncbi:MAG: hypothetical protein GX827_04930 [Clostridiales bacterium]|jgi:hypothetical protein|nr:hypothetical protein [Clostridiales bacterium]